jgi:hypothetical protein
MIIPAIKDRLDRHFFPFDDRIVVMFRRSNRFLRRQGLAANVNRLVRRMMLPDGLAQRIL